MTPEQAAAAAGLVTVLDVAGRNIADLEDRLDRLAAELAAERDLRASIEALLVEARALLEEPDTGRVDPSRPVAAHDGRHEPAAQPATR